jgi:competence protein ComEA
MGGSRPAPDRIPLYWLAFSALLSLGVAGAVVLALRWPPPGAMLIETPAPGAGAGAEVVVYVSGAVRQPGLYALPRGARAADALAAAGGHDATADLSRINLARRLADGERLHVPRTGEPVATGEPAGSAGERLDINVATAEELDALPGVGPTIAGRIVAYREEHGPFSTVEELQNVSGIGPATLERLRPHVAVR